MGIIRAPKSITDADIPAAIARDTETAAAIAAHAALEDPHPIYLTQAEGDGRYRQSAVPLADGDIPAAIARDAEFAAADLAHVGLSNPHPGLWARITNAFLALTGGQTIIKNNPAVITSSFTSGQNHLELLTTDGSNPILGFHRGGFTATALYHLGYGNNSLRIRNADGFDSPLLHNGNIGVRHVVILVTTNATSILAILLPPLGIVVDKIVSLNAIAKIPVIGVGTFWYVPPLTLDTYGSKYSIYINSSNALIIQTFGAVESSRMSNVEVRIVIGYIP